LVWKRKEGKKGQLDALQDFEIVWLRDVFAAREE